MMCQKSTFIYNTSNETLVTCNKIQYFYVIVKQFDNPIPVNKIISKSWAGIKHWWKTLNSHKQPVAWQFVGWRKTSKHVMSPFIRLEGAFQKSQGVDCKQFSTAVQLSRGCNSYFVNHKRNNHLLHRLVIGQHNIHYLYFPVPYSGMPTWFWTCFL